MEVENHDVSRGTWSSYVIPGPFRGRPVHIHDSHLDVPVFQAQVNPFYSKDYVEFNVRVSELESRLQEFINQSFHNIASIDTSLKLLSKFQSILQNGSLKTVPELERLQSLLG